MSNVLKMAAVGGAVSAETDEDFNQTVLLLHGDGTNGAQNNTFLDSSTNNFTITRNGNTTQGTFSPFSVGAGEWSNYFDGSGDYLSVADNANLELGSGDFTIECWMYLTGALGTYDFISKDSSAGRSWALYMSSTQIKTLLLYSDSSFNNFDTNFVFTANQWNHVALTRSGNTFRQFVNGSLIGTLSIGSAKSLNDVSSPVKIGARVFGDGTDYYFPGYISNARIVKGTAVYTSAFTPSTTPLTAISNTQLLTCQSNRFVDNSTNAFAITRNGDVKVTPFSPFAPSAAYSASTNGGSGYFDGSGDYLSAAATASLDLGGGDFTVEGWFYVLSTTANPHLFQFSTGSTNRWNIYRNTNFYIFSSISGVQVNSDTGDAVPLNQWFHLAVVKSSTTTKIYLNGVEIYSDGRSYPTGNMAFSMGFQEHSGLSADYLTGWVSNFRVVKGTAVYTAAFTPPTAPVTAVSGTELLLNFTNAGIFDNTGKNNLETVGNAQIDTTTKKYGTGSIEFDGTDDVLTFPPTPDLNLGTGDFTIEFWVNQSSNSSYKFIYSATGNQSDWNAGSRGFMIYLLNGVLGITTADIGSTNGSGALSLNTWYHIAVVKNGASFKGYIDGVLNLTRTNSSPVGSDTVGALIGAQDFYFGPARNPFQGFIDDLRITKGVARYTANFTPPTKAFPDQ